VRLAAAEHTKTLGSVSHSIEWLAWKAKYAPAEFSAENLRLYDEEIHASMGTLVGGLAVIAALDIETYEKFQVLTSELYKLDSEVSKVTARYQEEPQQVIAELSSLFSRAANYNRQLNRSIADMFAS
jgi:uncharacterized protein YydD (DUF2326 family)